MSSCRAPVWTVIRADKRSVWRDSNESRGFVPLLAHKHYIEHFSNFLYRFRGKLYRDNYRYRIIAQPYPSSSKNKLQHIQLSDTTGTSNETGFYGQINQICFLGYKLLKCLFEHLCVQIKYTAVFWGFGPIYQLEVLDMFRHMASWILSNTNRYKINKWLTLLEIL